mmetsp:Transcript_11916/g.27180  ORF Transcript_11916/g.27180 Transcript_11916/m.27180 type:complete len:638 (+) Transcript_11916:761-2674(+)
MLGLVPHPARPGRGGRGRRRRAGAPRRGTAGGRRPAGIRHAAHSGTAEDRAGRRPPRRLRRGRPAVPLRDVARGDVPRRSLPPRGGRPARGRGRDVSPPRPAVPLEFPGGQYSRPPSPAAAAGPPPGPPGDIRRTRRVRHRTAQCQGRTQRGRAQPLQAHRRAGGPGGRGGVGEARGAPTGGGRGVREDLQEARTPRSGAPSRGRRRRRGTVRDGRVGGEGAEVRGPEPRPVREVGPGRDGGRGGHGRDDVGRGGRAPEHSQPGPRHRAGRRGLRARQVEHHNNRTDGIGEDFAGQDAGEAHRCAARHRRRHVPDAGGICRGGRREHTVQAVPRERPGPRQMPAGHSLHRRDGQDTQVRGQRKHKPGRLRRGSTARPPQDRRGERHQRPQGAGTEESPGGLHPDRHHEHTLHKRRGLRGHGAHHQPAHGRGEHRLRGQDEEEHGGHQGPGEVLRLGDTQGPHLVRDDTRVRGPVPRHRVHEGTRRGQPRRHTHRSQELAHQAVHLPVRAQRDTLPRDGLRPPRDRGDGLQARERRPGTAFDHREHPHGDDVRGPERRGRAHGLPRRGGGEGGEEAGAPKRGGADGRTVRGADEGWDVGGRGGGRARLARRRGRGRLRGRGGLSGREHRPARVSFPTC